VKIGQIISSRARTLPIEWQQELERLQSAVSFFPYEQVRERIINELGAPPEELYAEFDETPLAAASLAQVHRATLHDRRRVAVKIQRPDIHAQLRSDVRILVRMSSATSYDLSPGSRNRGAEPRGAAGPLLSSGTAVATFSATDHLEDHHRQAADNNDDSQDDQRLPHASLPVFDCMFDERCDANMPYRGAGSLPRIR
jgi:hypothetical protein